MTTPFSQRLREHHYSNHHRGFSLIEVLVALLVLSLGLLGLAMLQTTGLRFNTESYGRTQATILAYDMADRIRLNAAGRAAGNYGVADTAAANAIISGNCITGGTCDCDTNACDAGTLAQYDLTKWYLMQDDLLPGAKYGNRSTIVINNKTMTITIRWMEQDVPKSQVWSIELI